MQLYIFLAATPLLMMINARECDRPEDLKRKEEYCWTHEIEIVDKIQQRGRTVLNFVKTKVGIAVEDDEPQKCEYYQCIFLQLKMLNANGYPAHDSITTWTKNFVAFNQAKQMIEQVDQCSVTLANSILRETNFYAYLVHMNETSYEESDGSEPRTQNVCETIAEFTKCLSKQDGCPVFKYP